MILWSIQHRNAYEKMMETGVMRADDRFSERTFKEEYKWMASAMKKKIGEPPTPDIHYPIWAWYQWEGKRKRPDMRTHIRWCSQVTPIVLLTVEVPDDKVVLSDFDAWHCVLNDYEITMHDYEDKPFDDFREEIEKLEALCDLSSGYEKEQLTISIQNKTNEYEKLKRESWENVFRYDEVTEYWSSPKTTQATMWEIKKEWVKKSEFFMSRL